MSAAGTWDDVFGTAPPAAQARALALNLRAMILAAHPGAVEVARPGYRAVSFGWSERKMSGAHSYLMPQADRVNPGFCRGADLPDPEGLLEGSGKALRHVKVRDLGRARTGAGPLTARIAAAVAERRPETAR